MQRSRTPRSFRQIATAGLWLFIGLAAGLLAQPAEIPFHMESYYLYSGLHNGPTAPPGQTSLAFSEIVKLNGAPWLRLYFSDAELGNRSYLILTSLQDGAWQRLNAVTLKQWQNSSAYFNGDAVKIELFAAPDDRNLFVRIDEVMAGEWASSNPIESQCGPTDDRIPSDDPRAGRLMSIGCTGWIITNGALVTAGHCLGGTVMQFNVPMSLPNGTVQHPGPEDQYSVDPASKLGYGSGIGNDWGVFQVFNNSVTGLHPIVAQGAAFDIVQDYTPDSIRITGYGVDSSPQSYNQIQQTHAGPNAGSSGTTMRYVTDTEGGNSGSPIIDEATNRAVGVHTHGGCTTSGGNNNGTSAYHTDFWAAINSSGMLVPLPPEDFTAYSDYITPTSMLLSWSDPTRYIIGDTLLAEDFTIQIERDGVLVDSVDGGAGEYLDQGLNDGQEYFYEIYAQLNDTHLPSSKVQFSWIAGGSPTPQSPANFSIAGNQQQVTLTWINPTANIDGTPMDDLAGVNLYQNGELVETFTRASADTGNADTAAYSPAVAGYYEWHLTALDNEDPANESEPTLAVSTPLGIPVGDEFSVAGAPNPGLWITSTAEVNNRAENPPSSPYALNLNGSPNGEDVVDLKGLDLTGLEGSGVALAYAYQPQGKGNAPEPEDSLRVYFKNSLEEWILVRSYPGSPNQPFVQESIEIESVPSGGGSFFHGQFQVRFRSTGGAGPFPNDDWFIDDVSITTPVGIEAPALTPGEYAVMQNYPNPFNPVTTIVYQLPQRSEVKLAVYNTLGQKVRTLLDQPAEAGTHAVEWNGRNDAGQPVASGIYVYRFSAGDYRKVQKMILLR